MSATLPAGMLSALRTTFNTALKDTCTISTPGAATHDAFDEEVAGSPTVVSGVRCSYAAVSAGERLAGGRVAEVGDYVVRLPSDTQVSSGATIAVDARGTAPARTFQVKADLHATDEFVTQVLATEI